MKENMVKQCGVNPAPSTPKPRITPSSQKSKKCRTCRGGETVPVYPPGPQGSSDRAPCPVCCKKEYGEFPIRIDLVRQLQRKHDLLLEERALMREAMSRLAAKDKEIERLQQEKYGLQDEWKKAIDQKAEQDKEIAETDWVFTQLFAGVLIAEPNSGQLLLDELEELRLFKQHATDRVKELLVQRDNLCEAIGAEVTKGW